MNSEKNSKGRKLKNPPFYNFCYDFVKITGAIPMLLWLRPKIYRLYKGRIPLSGTMLSANHLSLLDPVIVHTVFPLRRLHCLATKDLFNTKLKSAFFSRMHCIMVDKQNFTLSAFHEVVARLEVGRTVVIFPEGGLSDDSSSDAIRAFKSGAVLMAHKAGASIVPIYIAKREKWYRRQRIVVGSPFNVRDAVGNMPTLDQLNAATETLRQIELGLREYYESLPIYKKLHKNEAENHKTTEQEEKDEQKV